MSAYSIERPPEELPIALYRMSLPQEDQDRIVNFVTFSADFDPAIITRVVGRSVFFPLSTHIGIYDSVQISGAGSIDMGITSNTVAAVHRVDLPNGFLIRPPQASAPTFTHKTTIVEDGQATELVQMSPMGSYTQRSALAKYRNTQLIYDLVADHDFPFFVPYPITLVQYPHVPDGDGGSQSGVVFLCPFKGARADALISYIVDSALGTKDEERNKFVVDNFPTLLFPVMTSMGDSASFLHKKGYCHYQMTLGNVSPAFVVNGQQKICLYDWETLRTTDTKNPDLANAYDISLAIYSSSLAINDLLYKRLSLAEETAMSLCYSALLYYLYGYTGKSIEELQTRLHFTNRDIAILSFGDSSQILHQMLSVTIPRLSE